MTTKMPFIPERILMTADPVGGVWNYALDLARELGKHHISIALATMGAPLNAAQRAEAGKLPNVELYESQFKLEWMNDPWSDVERAGNWLLELEDRFCPDLVHLNGFCHGALPWRSPRIVVGHSCVLSWWRAVKGVEAPAEWNHYRDAVIEGLQLANMVVAPSGAMLAELNRYYGPFAASAVIANGRRLPIHPSESKHDFILAAGRLWDEAKNISALRLIAANLPWPVYLAGDATEPGNRNGSASALAGVNALGRLSPAELLPWFERAGIYALPARYEPFGLSALEAALAGCALVLGDIPSLRGIWGDAAVFVAPNDPAALQEALRDLIASPARRAGLAAKARRVAQQFTPERMAERYLSVYAEAMERHAREISNSEHRTSNAEEAGAGFGYRNSIFDFSRKGAACGL